MAHRQEFLLPDLGEGLTEATVVEWLVEEGQRVELNDPLVSVETAKAVLELPSPFAGVVLTLVGAAGETVSVGSPLVVIETQAPADAARGSDDSGPAHEVLVGPGPTGDLSVRRRRRRTVGAPPAAGAPPTWGTSTSSPVVRRRAAALGVELSGVKGTGVGGRITRADVEAAGAAKTAHPRAAVEPAGPGVAHHDGTTRVRADPIRRAMAKAMVLAVRGVPHAGTWTSLDAGAALDLVRSVKQESAGGAAMAPVTLLAIIAAAVVQGAREQPILNASWDAGTEEIVFHEHVNLGMATASPKGLIVPNVKMADELALPDLSGAIAALTAKATAGRCTVADMTGGTITISNIGSKADVGPGWPIINPPEAAIIGVGRVKRRPWVVDDQVLPRDVLELSISIDHRLIDGVQSCTFLETVARYVANPALLLYRDAARRPGS